jgi:hypothetical protein
MRKLVFSVWSLLLIGVGIPAVASHRFHATATAAGAPDGEAVASLSLAPNGGQSVTEVRNYSRGLLRFSEAVSVVSGTREGNVSVTRARTTIRNVAIAGRITADRIVTAVTCRHPAGAGEAEITFDGSEIENLAIDGVAVDASLDTAFFRGRPTFASFGAIEPRHGLVRCSLTAPAQCGSTTEALTIVIPGLGTLYVGEAFLSYGRRQVTMLRLVSQPTAAAGTGRFRIGTLGDSGDGETTVGTAEGNGADFLP